jgi:hypothetical protein
MKTPIENRHDQTRYSTSPVASANDRSRSAGATSSSATIAVKRDRPRATSDVTRTRRFAIENHCRPSFE